jgi:hypothetical protein
MAPWTSRGWTKDAPGQVCPLRPNISIIVLCNKRHCCAGMVVLRAGRRRGVARSRRGHRAAPPCSRQCRLARGPGTPLFAPVRAWGRAQGDDEGA